MYMTPKITAELRDAINQWPGAVRVEDDLTNRSYYLIDSATFARLQAQADLESLERGIADAEAGRTMSIDEVRNEVDAFLRERSSQ
jgi:predicted transcriptional regulator